ncbi:uncharacterized protein LOC121996228 [Zingiber officinale]|uniref:Uncharacterized protein n=1 Tax=Zingiber officinale TaxID=94328 RepID=A0A8J5G3Y3_ZINOF|nr:uncharacterized protein LOC121996228 [Zingiber officinale]XP_042406054.1 uncharacterized protein LOC121996228 [Zingiber officinale]KAG6499341.1 hypothetical protein ZIOFF_039105 [Zingiber officinale]
MLLSSRNSPDTRCSSKLPEVRTDERGSSGILASQEELDPPILGERTPNFSIRDYVFASRCKGIEASWPFSQQFLKFCLKHGIKELLPPFEPPDVLRADSLRKLEVLTQPTAGSEAEQVSSDLDLLTTGNHSNEDPSSVPNISGLTSKEPVLVQSIHPSLEDTNSTSNHVLSVNELSHSDVGIGSASGTSRQTEEILSPIGNPLSVSLVRSTTTQSQCEVTDLSYTLDKPREPSAKRDRQIVKLVSVSETRQTEGTVKDSRVIPHPMASKVCPVCKTFSFTSNTTLNAHIDQCLSMESNSKGTQSNVSIYKVKPKKKRLMVDVYASSSCCTLEDLDKRNGTNWSSELALLNSPTSGVDGLTKRQDVLPIHSEYDRTEPVYVDSDGVKLRILSKLSEQEISHETFELRKHAKESKAREALSISKKKHFASKHLKYMKLKAQNENGLSSNMKSQIHSTDKLDCNTQNHQKNDRSLTCTSEPEQRDKTILFATVKQWACAKRSQVRKRLSIEDKCDTSKDMLPSSNMNVQPDSGNSPDAKAQTKRLSSSYEELIGSPKTKRVNFLYNVARSMDQGKHGSMELPQPNSKSSSENLITTNSLVLKLSRSSGSFTCSSVLKLKEKDAGTRDRLNSASNRKTVMLKAEALKNNDTVKRRLCLEGSKDGEIEKQSIFKKLRKNSTVSRTIQEGELPPLNNASSSSPTCYGALPRIDGSETIGSNQCSTPRNITAFGGAMNDVTSQYSTIMEHQENSNSTNLSSQTQFHGTETETLGMQIEISDSRYYGTRSSMEKTNPNPISHDRVISEKVAPSLGTQLDSCQSEEHAQPIYATETCTEQFQHQEKFHADSNSYENGDQQIKLTEVKQRAYSHMMQPEEEPADDTLSLHESSGCLTCHNDVPERSSSTSSIRITASHSKNVSTDREPSGSPISTASTISLPSPSDLKFQGAEKSSGSASANDNPNPAIPSAESIEVAQEGNLDNREQETKEIVPDKKLHQCQDDKCLCGSCRERINKVSESFRQSGTVKTTLPKWVSNLPIRPRNSSSFDLYQNHNMTDNSETGAHSKSTLLKSSLDLPVKFPIRGNTCSPRPSLQSQNHSVSSPMLRLMGKNLLVQNHEGNEQSQPALNYSQQVNLSHPEYALNSNHMKQGNFQYQHNQLVAGPPRAFGRTAPPLVDHQIPLNLPRRPSGGGFTGVPLQSGCTAKLDQQIQQLQPRKDPRLSCQIMDQLIVIDDPRHENGARGFLTNSASNLAFTNSSHSSLPHTSLFYYPLQNQTVDYIRPLLPNLYSSANFSFMNQNISSENQGPFVPNPSLFQSLPGQRAPVMYYSRNLH